MAKYHISKSGTPGLCKATKACPLGEDTSHGEFANYEEATAWAEQELAKEYNDTDKGLTKKPVGNPVFNGYDTMMPDSVYEDKTVVIGTGALKKDDVILTDDGERDFTVTHAKKGTKNMTITGFDSKGKERTRTMPIGPLVPVTRKVETQESRDATMRALREASYEKVYKNFKPKRNEVLAAMTESAEKGYALSGSDISRLVTADAQDLVRAGYNQYVDVVTNRVEKGELDVENIYTYAADEYKKSLTRDVMSSSSRANSVSTNEAHNVHDRALLEAKAHFVERDGYFL